VNPYRDGRYVAPRGRWWRFRLWLAQWIVPSNEGAFLDRWDVTDDAKRLALSWDRGHIGRVEWNPECMGCGVPAPLEDRCRECGSRERRVADRVDILEKRIVNMLHMLDVVKRHEGIDIAVVRSGTRPVRPAAQPMPMTPEPKKEWS
jgi:hypothetical protein